MLDVNLGGTPSFPIAEALERGAPQGLRFGAVANQEQTNYPLTLLVNMGAQLSVHFSYQCVK